MLIPKLSLDRSLAGTVSGRIGQAICRMAQNVGLCLMQILK